MIERAIPGPVPGISHSRWTADRQASPAAGAPGPLAGSPAGAGGRAVMAWSIRVVTWSISAVSWSCWASSISRRAAWWPGEPAGEGLFQGAPLVPDDPRDGQGCQRCGVALANDQRRHDRSAGDAEDVSNDDRHFQQSVFQQFLDALADPGAVGDQAEPVAGPVADLA